MWQIKEFTGIFISGLLMIIRCSADSQKHPDDDIVCGQVSKYFENCFKNSTQSVPDIFNMTKIPYTNEEIEEGCIIFYHGIKCVHDYTSKCLDTKSKRLIEGEIAGAKRFYDMLCEDKEFKKDYLSHKDCFIFVQSDWNKCTNTFVSILREQVAKSEHLHGENTHEQFLEFCCVRYAYEACVYSSAKHKCKHESAIYTKKIVELMSREEQFQNCEKFQDDICKNTSTNLDISIKLFVGFGVINLIYSTLLL